MIKMDEQNFVDCIELAILVSQTRGMSQRQISYHISDPKIMPLNCYRKNKDDLLEVKESSIHGKGVFAKNNINKGQVVCIYPCHGIIEGNNLHTWTGEPNHFDPNLYKFEISPPSSTFIYGDPCIQDDGCLGHLINDPFPDISKFGKNLGKEMLEYMLRANILKNCAFIQRSHYVYIKTTKDIIAGEELLSPYGYPYWCQGLKRNQIVKKYKKYISTLSAPQRKKANSIFAQFMIDYIPLQSSKRILEFKSAATE